MRLMKNFPAWPVEQKLVIIFDKVHFKLGLRFISGHISGTFENKEEKLATSAFNLQND